MQKPLILFRAGRAVYVAGCAVCAAVSLALFAPLPISAEANFGGDFISGFTFNVPGSDEYESPVNPGNLLGVGDVTVTGEVNLKLDAAGETSALDVWLQAGIDASGAAQTDIIRANTTWMPSSDVRFTLGRQSFLTGYGYGWNPADLANPPKNPADPQGEVRGVDGINIRYSPASWLTVRIFGLIPSGSTMWDYDDLLSGTELTFYAPAVEVKLSGLYGGLESDDDAADSHPNAGAGAVYLDVAGIGVYAEGVIRSRSRRNDPASDGDTPVIPDGPVGSGLFGVEYSFNSGLALAAEYFFNGEGWDQDRRDDYADALEALAASTGITPGYFALYTPAYYARHYLLLNLGIPLYAIDSNANLNLIYSPDSQAFMVTPEAAFNLNYEGTLVSELRYSALVSLDDGAKNEAWLSPVHQSVLLNLKYFF